MSSSAIPSSKSPEFSIPHFHSGSDFEYEKFYQSAKGLAASIVKPGSADLTTIFRNTDEDVEGRNYFQYRFSKSVKQQSNKRIKAAIKFLESYRIYAGREEGDPIRMLNETAFSIIRMYHGFSSLTVWEKPLAKSSLSTYFGEIEDREVDFSVLKDPADPNSYNQETVKEFVHAESLMIGLILKELNEDSSYFLPVPLIARGRLMGAVYLVFDESKLQQKMFKKKSAQQLFFRAYCLGLTREYERIALERRLTSFAARPSDPLEGFEQVFNDLNISYFFSSEVEREKQKTGFNESGLNPAIISGNDFLEDMGYRDFYEHYASVYVTESLAVQKRKKETLKRAVTAIIVDSFAHNVGAHSLVALKWWFEQRFKDYDKSLNLLKDGKPLHLIQYVSLPHQLLSKAGQVEEFHADMSASDTAHTSDAVSFLDVIRFSTPKQLKNFFSFYDFEEWNDFHSSQNIKQNKRVPLEPWTQFPIPTDSALYQYFEFLRNKSAFWSGVSRDLAFSGGVRTLRFLLQKFLNNTLFLGTVAHSEGINKVNVYLEFLKDEEPGEQKEEILISGQYAVIDLNIIRKNDRSSTSDLQSEGEENEEFDIEKSGIKTRSDKKYSDFAFLREGKDYYELKKQVVEFDKTPLFFPGGIVGEQALFTLLENTLRNIKHYRRSLTLIGKTGINLYLSFKRVGFIERNGIGPTKNNKLVRIGTWLHHKQDLYITGNDGEPVPVIQKQTEQLKERIIDSAGGVRLGGSSQDKVCASFLLNGTFESIDAFHPYEAKKHYYPYVYSSSESFIEPSERLFGVKPNETVFHITYNKVMRSENSDRKERHLKYQLAIQQYFKSFPPVSEPKGTIKKYFHVWRGEDFRIATESFHPANELLARNKVVAIDRFIPKVNADPLSFMEARKVLRKSGLVRIINVDDFLRGIEHEKMNTDNPTRIMELAERQYQYSIAKWLGEWLQPVEGSSSQNNWENTMRFEPNNIWVEFYHDGHQIGVAQLIRKSEAASWELFYHTPKALLRSHREIIIPRQFHRIELAHGQHTQDTPSSINQFVKVRSHGSLLTDILNHTSLLNEQKSNDAILSLNKVKAGNVKTAELLETVLTRIVIYDNRVFDRLPGAQKLIDLKKPSFKENLDDEKSGEFKTYRETKTVMKDTLLLEAFPERGKFIQDDVFAYALKNTHFLIIHLSYLETIWKYPNTPGQTFREDQVIEFFEMRIKSFYQERFGKELPLNFMLVITSGRGRADWIDRLVEQSDKADNPRNYFDQITFRAVESIVGAIEDGIVMNDDFQIKYNLCKVLYGS